MPKQTKTTKQTKSAQKSVSAKKIQTKQPVKAVTKTKPVTKKVPTHKLAAVKRAPKKVEPAHTTATELSVDSNEEIVSDVDYIVIPKSTGRVALIVAIVVVGLLIALAARFSVAAMVNGQPISRLALYQKLQDQYGSQTLDLMVTEKVIETEAAKKGIAVTDDQVQDELASISAQFEAQGQTLDNVIAQQGLTRTEVERQVRLQKMLEALSSESASVSAEDIASYLETNGDYLPETATQQEKEDLARQQLSSQNQQQQIQQTLSSLKAQASIKYFLKFPSLSPATN